jgi:hypothetical protein
LILHPSYSNRFRHTAILPFNTLSRYFGIHTMWYNNQCFVCNPVRYLAIARLCQIYLRAASFTGSAPSGHSSPGLKAMGFSGRSYKTVSKKLTLPS